MKNVLCILTALACSAGTSLLAQEAPATPPAPQENSSPSTATPASSAAAVPAPVPAPGNQAQASPPAAAPSVSSPASSPSISTDAPPSAVSQPVPEPAPAAAEAPAPAPASAPAGKQIEEKLQQVINAHADKDLGTMMKEVSAAFPDSLSVSVGESSKIVNGEGQRVVTVSVTDKNGVTSTSTLTTPLDRKAVPAVQKTEAGGVLDLGNMINEGVQIKSAPFRDEMAEALLGRADRICELLDGIRDKAGADKAAPQLWEQCVQLESMLDASRSRRLPQRYLGRMIEKYNGAMETRFNKMDHLISALAEKNYYGSATLKRAAEQLCE